MIIVLYHGRYPTANSQSVVSQGLTLSVTPTVRDFFRHDDTINVDALSGQDFRLRDLNAAALHWEMYKLADKYLIDALRIEAAKNLEDLAHKKHLDLLETPGVYHRRGH